MALWPDVASQSARIFGILLLFIAGSGSKKSQIYYTEGADCEGSKTVGGGVVYSHRGMETNRYYRDNIGCRITFRAAQDDWHLMLRVVELDIPDKALRELCNDALYVYDANTIIGQPVKKAGGNGGLCGSKLPPVIYSSGPFLTIYFRTDPGGISGKGFKIILTAFSTDFEQYETCGSLFQCGNNKCIDPDLMCDGIDHCGDHSDESAFSGAHCGGKIGNGMLEKFLSLGVTAAISITVGSVVIFIVLVVCIVCCCCKCMRKDSREPTAATTTTTATSVTINNGAPPIHYQGNKQIAAPQWHVTPSYRSSYEDLGRAYSHAGSSVYSCKSSWHQAPAPAPAQFHPGYVQQGTGGYVQQGTGGYVQQGYYPMQAVPGGQPGMTYSPFAGRESYSQGSAYSSQPPPSYHRSYTPTSSRSGRSKASNESSVKFIHDKEKVALPVNV